MWIPQMFLRPCPMNRNFLVLWRCLHSTRRHKAECSYRHNGRTSAAWAGRAAEERSGGREGHLDLAARNQQTILLLSFISIPAHPRVTSSVSDDANDEGPSRSAAMLGCNSAGRIHGWRLSRSRAAAETHHIWRALAPGWIGCAIWGRGPEGSARGSVGELAADWIVSARLTSSAEIW